MGTVEILAQTVKNSKPKKKRVAAYARVSTLQDEQAGSYNTQVLTYTKQIKSNPDWEFVSVYGDCGRTGTSVSSRPSFNAMLKAAKNGEIDLILTKSITRFSRNALDTLTITRELRNLGVEVYFEEQRLSTLDHKCEAVLAILAGLAQEESRNLSENIRWGITRKMEKGEFTLPYKRFLGYKRGKYGAPEIDKREAKVVQRIYWLFQSGVSIGRICKIMEKKGIPSPGGSPRWQYNTVWRILTNEKYAGMALLQKTYTPDYLDHKAVANEGDVRQYLIEHSHPAIIYIDDWKKVQEKLGRKDIPFLLEMSIQK